MDTFSNSAFEGFLKEHAVGQLILTGMAAEACVDRTCQGALNRKYHVTVVRDAIASASDESREKKIRDYEKYGAQITTSQDILTTHR
jgi:nicotinamidase-related amidase